MGDEDEPKPWYEESWAVVSAGVGAVAVVLVLIYAVIQTSESSIDPGLPPAPATIDAPASSRTTTTTTTRSTRTTAPSTSDINPSDTSPGSTTTTTDDWVPDFPELTGTTTTTTTDPYATSTSAPRAGAV